MFSVNNDGAIVYNENLIDDGTLFGDAPHLSQDPLSDPEVLKKIQEDIAILESGSNIDVSSGDAATNVQTVNYYTVYAVPSGATGFPNSNSVNYLEDVVKGYPLDYGYVSYRTDDQYAQSMILFIGPEYSYENNLITIRDCDVIELNYTTSSGYNSYIDKTFYHEDIAEIQLSENTLAYTNIAPGYAAFDTSMVRNAGLGILPYLLIGLSAFFVLKRLIGGYRHG